MKNILRTVSRISPYLYNFPILMASALVMRALQAGCTQRPPAGLLIGLDGTVFSKTTVNITYPGDNHEKKRKGLSQAGIIGISISAALFLLMLAAALFVCYRKHRDRNRMSRLKSPLDSRFGAPNITSPNIGAYGNPYAAPAVSPPQPFDQSSLSVKERQVMGLQKPVGSRHISSPSYPTPKSWEGTSQPTNNHLPPYSPPGMPTHQAYIPNGPAMVPESPVTSIASSGTYQNSPYSSPRPSPRYNPATTPSIQSSRGTPLSPAQPLGSPQNRDSVPSQTPYAPSQTSPQPPPTQLQSIQTRLEPRSNPRASARRVITKFTSTGGSNTTTGFSSPVQISAPMATHGPRFEHELHEQHERDQHGRRRKPETPQSAESEEQWPGSY